MSNLGDLIRDLGHYGTGTTKAYALDNSFPVVADLIDRSRVTSRSPDGTDNGFAYYCDENNITIDQVVRWQELYNEAPWFQADSKLIRDNFYGVSIDDIPVTHTMSGANFGTARRAKFPDLAFDQGRPVNEQIVRGAIADGTYSFTDLATMEMLVDRSAYRKFQHIYGFDTKDCDDHSRMQDAFFANIQLALPVLRCTFQCTRGGQPYAHDTLVFACIEQGTHSMDWYWLEYGEIYPINGDAYAGYQDIEILTLRG